MKFVSIVGARPEFVQAAPVSRALRARHHEILLHTGQHYDYRMSGAFFDQLGVPAPDYNLEIGSGSHGAQTARMLEAIESVLSAERPDMVFVRGDTNSTLAGALAAAKLNIPVAHIEAGERSYDRTMPEEINRVATDHVSALLLCSSRISVDRLAAEGIREHVHFVGDVMHDTLLHSLPLARASSTILDAQGLRRGGYALVTIHRAANTDDAARLDALVTALNEVDEPIVLPVHPRTRLALKRCRASLGAHIRLIDPASYFDMLVLEENARLIATDSGGVQREAYMLGIPCLTLRESTEWMETVTAGWNRLVGVDRELILGNWTRFQPASARPPLFGDGHAAERIAEHAERFMAARPRNLAPALSAEVQVAA